MAIDQQASPVTAEELAAYFELHADDAIEDPDAEAASELPSDDEEFAAGPGEPA